MKKDFVVPEADVKGNFSDFPTSKLETVTVKKGKKIEFIVAQDSTNGRHNIGTGELADLQAKNPSVPIMVKADKTIAVLGETAQLNSEITIGREEGLLVLGS